MSYHRLLETREIGGRLRLAGSLIDHVGAPVPFLEPLGVAQHRLWLRALAEAQDPPRRAEAA